MVTKNQLSFYPALMAGFSVVLICANFIGPAKVCQIDLPIAVPVLGSVLIFGAGNIFFPISYIFGDILTEIYGYAKTRRVIWVGFFSMIFASMMAVIIINLPPAETEPHNRVLQPALELVFGSTWRVVLGSILGFWIGDFINAFVMAKIKVITEGRHLWFRTISSTIFGQAADSLIFYPIAFWGIWNTETIINVILFNFFFKVFIEVIMTPFTYFAVITIKKHEKIDFYDTNTNFNPFSLKNY